MNLRDRILSILRNRTDLQAHERLALADDLISAVGIWLGEDMTAHIDTVSSASRQHYIDTGRYLRVGEAFDA